LKALVLQGKGKYAQQKHFGGCMHKEGVFCYLSLEAILLQGKEETDAQQKHFERCMHKECFLICPLKHLFSKGKKKTIAQQKNFGNACTRRECLPIVP
jgi:hypothetical protein